MTFYPPKINERFLNPNNAGEINSQPSATGASGSFVCGAALKIFLRVENGKITDAKFKAAGCGFLFAAAEVLCEQIKNKEFAEVGKAVRAEAQRRKERINRNRDDVRDVKTNDLSCTFLFEIDFESEFSAHRKHCLELCEETLRAAIDDYRVARLESWNGDEALICTCFGVSETTIEMAIVKNELTSVEEVTENCRAGGGCGSCQGLILEILDDVWRGET